MNNNQAAFCVAIAVVPIRIVINVIEITNINLKFLIFFSTTTNKKFIEVYITLFNKISLLKRHSN
jgi:hypothetical protein